MYIEQLHEAVGHLKAAAIGALLRKLDFTFDGSHYVGIIPLGSSYVEVRVTPPSALGVGGGETSSDSAEAKAMVDERHNFPVQFDNVRGYIDEIFAPFFTLPEPTFIEAQEQVMHDALRNLYIKEGSPEINATLMPSSFDAIYDLMGKVNTNNQLDPNDTVTSDALETFRSHFLSDVQNKLDNTSRKAIEAYICIMAQRGLIKGAFTDTIAAANSGTTMFNNYQNTGLLGFAKILTQIGIIAAGIALPAAAGLTAAVLAAEAIALTFLNNEINKEIEMGGGSFEECLDSLRSIVQACADNLRNLESHLADTLKDIHSKMVKNKEEYTHDPEGKGPGFRGVIHLAAAPLSSISNVHLKDIISHTEKGISTLLDVNVEDAAYRDPSLGYGSHGAMEECQNLIIDVRKAFEELKQDMAEGKINLDATVNAIKNADDEIYLTIQNMSAEAMRD